MGPYSRNTAQDAERLEVSVACLCQDLLPCNDVTNNFLYYKPKLFNTNWMAVGGKSLKTCFTSRLLLYCRRTPGEHKPIQPLRVFFKLFSPLLRVRYHITFFLVSSDSCIKRSIYFDSLETLGRYYTTHIVVLSQQYIPISRTKSIASFYDSLSIPAPELTDICHP